MKKDQILDRVLNLDYVVSGICLTALVVITFLSVIWRYIFNNPFTWGEEVQLLLITWVIYFGASAAFRTGGHVAIDMVVDLLPGKIQKLFDILIYLVTVGVVLFYMVNSIALIRQFAETSRVSNVLKIPNQYIYIAIPAGCVLMIINCTIYLVRAWNAEGRKEAEDGN